jgi:hypothetical protein
MTVRELCTRMDSRELSEWIAYTRYFSALPDSWEQTGLIVASLMAPYATQGDPPNPKDYVPTSRPPQHPEQQMLALMQLQKELNG